MRQVAMAEWPPKIVVAAFRCPSPLERRKVGSLDVFSVKTVTTQSGEYAMDNLYQNCKPLL